MERTFHIVDVFAEAAFEGNQLAVVLDAAGLSTAEMQAIAREMNFSETTFVCGGVAEGDVWPVRIFTPAQELPFAGHPTLGTAWVIRQSRLHGLAETVTLGLGQGNVPVRFQPGSGNREHAWLTAPEVTPEAIGPGEPLATALGLESSDLDPRFPVRKMSVGIEVVVVPLVGRDALERSRLSSDDWSRLAPDAFPPFVYLFCREATRRGIDLSARFFFDANGVREDPATGSATVCLGSYLLQHDYFGRGELELRIEQGVSMGRPSLLLLRAARGAGGDRIEVGGGVVPIAEGQLRVQTEDGTASAGPP